MRFSRELICDTSHERNAVLVRQRSRDSRVTINKRRPRPCRNQEEKRTISGGFRGRPFSATWLRSVSNYDLLCTISITWRASPNQNCRVNARPIDMSQCSHSCPVRRLVTITTWSISRVIKSLLTRWRIPANTVRQIWYDVKHCNDNCEFLERLCPFTLLIIPAANCGRWNVT